ncbi:UDP-N-acetylmuramate dehydrogenase [Spelaeicoccus albus]|uniref:UDP-N-acetylenolpyruvoylglucosamine reductase n=1 Tax=Spelaeicoccus albus TaxID=1280376 RepID=A0A7Z0D5S4_9MICO|nr:UDP-N-acetylmuramate dehydrogenase [Spelaeicoccus albus]NYI69354.1 UDP-N-acetylmuramate dehydrogenase [Spelaeicoccus albus]
MTGEGAPSLADLTTFKVGGPIGDYRRAATREELVGLLAEHPMPGGASGRDVLVLGGGSNLLVADEGFTGTVIHVRTRGITVTPDGPGRALVRVEAGMTWDDVVARTLEEGLSGLEALSGVPGSAGATPVQNVGAYGTEVATRITTVHVWDRQAGAELELSGSECEFAYRDSLFKRTARALGQPRYIVLDVEFALDVSDGSAPVAYAELARTLGVRIGERASAQAVRHAVLRLRAGKGMVLDKNDPDTYSAGSFFTNPIIEPSAVPDGAPTWPVDGGLVKSSAAWLIDHAGFAKGFGIDPSVASLSTKHTLALTNRGSATASDLIELARVVRAGVRDAYGIDLRPEPDLIGCRL